MIRIKVASSQFFHFSIALGKESRPQRARYCPSHNDHMILTSFDWTVIWKDEQRICVRDLFASSMPLFHKKNDLVSIGFQDSLSWNGSKHLRLHFRKKK